MGCGTRGGPSRPTDEAQGQRLRAACDVAKDRSRRCRLDERTQANRVDHIRGSQRHRRRHRRGVLIVRRTNRWGQPETSSDRRRQESTETENAQRRFEPAVKMLEGIRKSNRIVQIGPRSGAGTLPERQCSRRYVGGNRDHCHMCRWEEEAAAASAARPGGHWPTHSRGFNGRCSGDRVAQAVRAGRLHKTGALVRLRRRQPHDCGCTQRPSYWL